MTDNKALGNWGEQFAKEYLLKQGYFFIAQNYQSGHAEIDLIFKLGKKLIFIEVKTRLKTAASRLENPLARWQIKNLEHALISYCLGHRVNLDNFRLDLIIILVDKKTRRADLKHYPNIL